MKKTLCILFLLASPLHADEPIQPPPQKTGKAITLVVSLFALSIVTILLASNNLNTSTGD